MSVVGDSLLPEKRGGDMGKNIWSSLLSEVSSRSTSSRFSGAEKNILILGDDLSGKTTLATKLQGKEDPHRGSALEYQFMEIQEDDADEKAVCGIWILEGHRSFRSLLNFALPKNRISDTIILITVDMSQPWNIIESLDTWTQVIREHVDQLKITADELSVLEKKVVEDFQKYIDPAELTEDGLTITSPRLSSSKESTDNTEDVSIPLGENTLTCNLGIPLIVVCTKCDYTDKLEKDHDYKDEHFDFIQHRLRTFCLKYGAALFYTSVKDNKNMEILYKYLLHKLYGLPCVVPASVVDKDAVFVPCGWDTEKKISILVDNFAKLSPSDAYESVIQRPIVRKPLQEMKELTVEDEQSFLGKAQGMLSAPPSSSARASVPNRPTVDPSRMKAAQPGRATIGGLSGASAAKIKPDPNKPPQSNERVLANFFNSLLNKKPTSASSPGKGSADKTAADLARLQQQAKQRNSSSSSTSKQSTEAS